ncbi:uncharacterized protein LOC115453874 isoform X2 [Manduca sexta]|nr:uncharacterized protein LOC115453874 isoform X2 [Manduca sexta]
MRPPRVDSRPIYSNPKGGRRFAAVSRISRASLKTLCWTCGTICAMLWTCCLILCLVAGSSQLSITEFVVPSSIEVGQNAELRCRYEILPGETEKGLFVKWWWTPAKGERKQLYQRMIGHPAQSTQHKLEMEIKENDTIVLQELQPNATGTYECEVSIIDEIRKHQDLIVYSQGTGPQLNISVEPDGPDEDDQEDIQIECEAEGVAPLPDLTVSVNGKEINTTETLEGPDDEGFYTVTSNSTLSKFDVDGFEIRCELFYANPNITHAEFITTEIYDSTADCSYQVRSTCVLLLAVPMLTQLFVSPYISIFSM